jgi:hypothetical protein
LGIGLGLRVKGYLHSFPEAKIVMRDVPVRFHLEVKPIDIFVVSDPVDIISDTKIIAFRFCVLQSRKIKEKNGEDNFNNVHMQITGLVS